MTSMPQHVTGLSGKVPQARASLVSPKDSHQEGQQGWSQGEGVSDCARRSWVVLALRGRHCSLLCGLGVDCREGPARWPRARAFPSLDFSFPLGMSPTTCLCLSPCGDCWLP